MEHILSQWRTDREASRRGRRAAWWTAAAVLFGLPAWLGAVQAGLLPLSYGYTYEQWSSRAENMLGWSGRHDDWTFGTDLFFLRAGQRVYIDYQATVYEGGYTVMIVPTGTPGADAILKKRILASGTGRIEAAVPDSGLYQFLYFAHGDPHERTGGHEAFCRVMWGIVG